MDQGDGPDVGGIILAGGTAVRLGGADKATIDIAGRTLLEHAIDAMIDLAEVVVVGIPVPTNRPVTFLREDPPGGGPAAGLLAGLSGFPRLPDLVVVLAVDMPCVTAATIRRLTRSMVDDGALLADESGRRQPLCGVYSTAALQAHRPPYEQEFGLSVHALIGNLRLAEVAGIGDEARDVDSWDDLTQLRSALEA
ncbi:MAG: molybdopterin-guanine dinucleotide biosynthesis protein [Marmoricola sp.]|jgi:molybdopterin-guanine dinucleotide biosynthesis protein A|nr:molybdopterin-guanine dinucleotide biosynthesis protein [Marmoricola sp.]